MNTISRKDLKHNFLKRIIIRVDFSGILHQEIEDLVIKLKPYLMAQGFERFTEKVNNQFDVEITASDFQDHHPQSQVNLIDNYIVYNFTNESNGISIDISHLFVCIIINSSKYINFEEYAAHIFHIINIFQANINYFKMNRVGLRKINSCIFKDKSKIKSYFKESYFNTADFNENMQTLNTSQRYFMKTNNRNINFITDIQEGNIENSLVYQVVLDIDEYITEECIPSTSEGLVEEIILMNTDIFNIYANSLTKLFLQKLTSDSDFEHEYLIGVNNNE